MDRELLKKSLHSRYACRAFDATKKIPQEDIEVFAQTIQLAPSSMGLEPVRCIFVSKQDDKNAVAQYSHTKEPLQDCSHIAILMNQKSYITNPKNAQEHYLNFKSLKGAHEKAQMLAHILEDRFNNESRLITGYVREQVYLAMGDMLRIAALLHIDSLVIGGFNPSALYKWLDERPNTFTQKFTPCVLVALGYKKENIPPKQRLPLQEIVSYL